MEIDWRREAEGIAPELTALRRAIHRHPELGNREFQTAERVETALRSWGIETERMLDTAVVGRLHGAHTGPTVAIRADMDALPIQEATGSEFASEVEGVMHACGHDVHMAAALGAAKLLSNHRAEFSGSVAFLFQPDEEGSGGAQRMIQKGVLEGVDAVFGAHVSPELPAGSVGIRHGKFYAASDTFQITLTGKSAHGAERHKGVDALAAGAELTLALLSLPEALGGERSVVSVGTLRAGRAINVVADSAELSGIVRTLGPEARKRMRELLREAVRMMEDRTGVTAELRLRESYPGVVNEDTMTDLAWDTAVRLLGEGQVFNLTEPTMTTEDFGYFLLERPGCFYHIGAGCEKPLHNPEFLPAEESVLTGAAIHAAVAEAFLNRQR